jgi:hypothetical protein
MFKLDNNFLNEIGLGELPDPEKNKMLAHILDTLEMRVGMELASGMSNEQLEEFEGFIGGDISKATTYLSSVNANWQNDSAYLRSIENEQKRAAKENRQPNPNAVTSEFAALKWLENNFPSYKQVVSKELDKLKTEIKQAAPTILSEVKGSSSPQNPQIPPQS